MTNAANKYEIVAYVKYHPVAILGTVGKSRAPHGAAIYVCATSADQLYFVTKTETAKFQNLLRNRHVSVTIADPEEVSSLQADGKAYVVSDPKVIEMVMEKMAKIYAKNVDWLPPLAKLDAGPYQVVGIKLSSVRLGEFKFASAGGKIYKELNS